ncbi:carboxymuconolactone decarboxylase family protein [Zavarzinia sp. CC-PAN008]|uniref:carboxymuconolactone decarboxylase family protein n=1 Tax=Zavarzinia sp. CC-PAN008 TaxID=3243332 RepID=UPI003F7430B9
MSDDDTRARGLDTIRRVFGRVPGPATQESPIIEHTIEQVFGRIWSRAGLTLQQRSMITVTTLIALGREHELRIHLGGARNLGLDRATVEEIVLHVAHYAGWPAGISAQRLVDEVYGPATDKATAED